MERTGLLYHGRNLQRGASAESELGAQCREEMDSSWNAVAFCCSV